MRRPSSPSERDRPGRIWCRHRALRAYPQRVRCVPTVDWGDLVAAALRLAHALGGRCQPGLASCGDAVSSRALYDQHLAVPRVRPPSCCARFAEQWGGGQRVTVTSQPSDARMVLRRSLCGRAAAGSCVGQGAADLPDLLLTGSAEFDHEGLGAGTTVAEAYAVAQRRIAGQGALAWDDDGPSPWRDVHGRRATASNLTPTHAAALAWTRRRRPHAFAALSRAALGQWVLSFARCLPPTQPIRCRRWVHAKDWMVFANCVVRMYAFSVACRYGRRTCLGLCRFAYWCRVQGNDRSSSRTGTVRM